ncbi:MAG: DUF4301 family protein [Bacteroidales bacterium]|nr:DUF4301 family protein [Bacteroidales bacterium]
MTQKEQIERFKEGFPSLDIVSAATIGRGIVRLDDKQLKEASDYCDTAQVAGKCKFVPASGAASRMFKDVFAHKPETIEKLADNIEKFAFYDPAVFGKAPYDPVKTADALLEEPGLGYGAKPKGVLKFHRYKEEARTAFAEHLVEGQKYMRNADGTVNLTFTISPEHQALFEKALAEVKDEYEKRYGVKYNIRFTYQDKATDTIAVTPDNKPFLKEDGTVLTRPAGHGALIHNLGAVDEELVSIKNIDNVAVERLLPTTALYKKALMGRALQLRDRVFGYLVELDQLAGVSPMIEYSRDLVGYLPPIDDPFATDEAQAMCNEIEKFLLEEFCIEMPQFKSCKERALALRAKLDRPLRVCGMVRNEGEPGGGPFIIREKDGSTSLQILESVQISDPSLMKDATHFNPVDLVCCLRGVDGKKFNLLDHVDPETGFISSKSYQGRELKALELPGLWNGAMSDWLTSFVEVPIETFNPVKVVLDLLKPAHQV